MMGVTAHTARSILDSFLKTLLYQCRLTEDELHNWAFFVFLTRDHLHLPQQQATTLKRNKQN